jgi:hypothetical protein
MQQNLPKTAQNSQNLLKSAQRQNFEIPPKFEILVFSKIKIYTCRGDAKACFNWSDFQSKNFLCLFYCQKMAFVCEFQHTPFSNDFFSQCSTPLVGMRFWRHVRNSLRNKNMERFIPFFWPSKLCYPLKVQGK